MLASWWVDLLQESGRSALHTELGKSWHAHPSEAPEIDGNGSESTALHPHTPTPTMLSPWLAPGRRQGSAGGFCFVSTTTPLPANTTLLLGGVSCTCRRTPRCRWLLGFAPPSSACQTEREEKAAALGTHRTEAAVQPTAIHPASPAQTRALAAFHWKWCLDSVSRLTACDALWAPGATH